MRNEPGHVILTDLETTFLEEFECLIIGYYRFRAYDNHEQSIGPSEVPEVHSP
jgi:hypothetical protein